MNKKLVLEIGKKFGQWTIISDKTVTKNNLTHWYCKCQCGKEQYVPLNNLMNGSSTQCKICSIKKGGLKRRKGFGDISGDYWAQIKSQAKRKNINFEIRIEEAWELFLLQKECCALSGNKIILSGYVSKLKNTAILDRIEPKLGFIKYNCQWIHKNVAHIKPSNMGSEDFLEIIYDCFHHNFSK